MNPAAPVKTHPTSEVREDSRKPSCRADARGVSSILDRRASCAARNASASALPSSAERRASRAARRAAFTLIELVIVIGIMALMMVLAVPAFQSVTKSSAVGIGASHLVNVLTLARTKAITGRTHVRVVFADGSHTNATIFPKVSYAVLMWTNQNLDPLVDDTASSWIYLDRWQSLPKGAYFSTLPSSLSATTPFPSNLNTGVSLAGLQFNSAGALVSGSDESAVVREGVVMPNGTVTASSSANTNAVVISYATGRAKVNR